MFIFASVFTISVCENANSTSGRSYNIIAGVNNIEDCSFQRSVIYDEQGGVIYCLGDTIELNILRCMFSFCKANKDGGAIMASVGNFSIKYGCGFSCFVPGAKEGVFGYISVKKLLFLNESSLTVCSYEIQGVYCIRLVSGIQNIHNFNSSFNKCNQISGFGCVTPVEVVGTFITVFSNQVNTICMYFYGGSKNNIYFSNIINNTSPNSFGIVTGNINSLMSFFNCIFTNNSHILFYNNQQFIYVSNSYISHLQVSSGSLSTISVINQFTSSMMISHYGTRLCPADVIENSESTKIHTIPSSNNILLLLLISSIGLL